MLAVNGRFIFINCAVVGDQLVHRLRLPASAIGADLLLQLAGASPKLPRAQMEYYRLVLARRANGHWLTTQDPEIRAITTAADVETLLRTFPHDLDGSMRIADAVAAPDTREPIEIIHVIAYPLGDASRARCFARRLDWLRRLQTMAAIALVPSTIWAAVDAIGAQSVGVAACAATICTAIAGATVTAIQVCDARRTRALAATETTQLTDVNDADSMV